MVNYRIYIIPTTGTFLNGTLFKESFYGNGIKSKAIFMFNAGCMDENLYNIRTYGMPDMNCNYSFQIGTTIGTLLPATLIKQEFSDYCSAIMIVADGNIISANQEIIAWFVSID